MTSALRSLWIPRSAALAVAALLSCSGLYAADPPSTAPATQATSIEPDVTTVKRGNLDLTVETSAIFEAADPFEVRVHPRRYIGDLLVVHAIAPGKRVAKGDLLLEIEPTQLQNAITIAASDLAVAKVNQTAAEAMADLGRKDDDLVMQEARRSAQRAVDELAWFEKIGADQWKDTVELESKIAASSKEAQSDELSELRKMYKSEELTNATADIVVKRALRNLEIASTNSKIKDETAEKILKMDFDEYHERLRREIPTRADAVAELDLRQKQAAIARDAALTTAKVATTEAQTKLSQLQDDLQLLTIHSPIDGIAVYGEFANKVWYPVPPRQLNPGEKIAAGQIFITIYQPGIMRARLQGPEANLLLVHDGIKVKLSPVALPGLSYEGTCGPAVPVAGSVAGAQSFDVLIALPPVDEQIIPGFKAQATARVTLNNVLLVPSAAITDGKVRIHRPDGSEQSTAVIAGRSNGKFTQILSGLTEGQQILTKGKP